MLREAQFLDTERIGQVSGAFDDGLIRLTDARGWPLTNDLGWWGIGGVDMGPSTDHANRLYIFFGDVVPTPGASGRRMQDTDAVAWSDDTRVARHGGHVSGDSWNFFLANDAQPPSRPAQTDWRFCRKCLALFFALDGHAEFSRCAAGGSHDPAGFNYRLLNNRQGAQPTDGQPDWVRCRKCQSLFWGLGASVCPSGGRHEHAYRVQRQDLTWNYVLPNDRQGADAASGQDLWRHCATCGMLFWNGTPYKGVCPGARGGGFRLNIVTRDDLLYDEFAIEGPICATIREETPVGAFSDGTKVHVFAWVGPRTQVQPPPPGSYVASKVDPSQPGLYGDPRLIGSLDDAKGFWQVSPVLVHNAEHGDLPYEDGRGVVLFGYGGHPTQAAYVAWMPPPRAGGLAGELESRHETWYLSANPSDPWTTSLDDAMPLFSGPVWTTLSAMWLRAARCWVLLSTTPSRFFDERSKVVVRVASTLRGLGEATALTVFDPELDGAWDRYMHRTGPDDRERFQPPEVKADAAAWAYGAFLLERFTEWDSLTGEIGLYYLMSTAVSYQVHVMHTRLRLRAVTSLHL